jgi:hypothetical protein
MRGTRIVKMPRHYRFTNYIPPHANENMKTLQKRPTRNNKSEELVIGPPYSKGIRSIWDGSKGSKKEEKVETTVSLIDKHPYA